MVLNQNSCLSLESYQKANVNFYSHLGHYYLKLFGDFKIISQLNWDCSFYMLLPKKEILGTVYL